jgi:hypothetical protein
MRTRRPDGTVVSDLTLMRRMMPFVMPTRAESTVFHEQIVDLRRTLPFLEAWSAAHPQAPLKLFDLVICAVGRALHRRPGLSRFVAGGRLYERREQHISFAVKRERVDHAALRTVKLAVRADEPLPELAARLRACIEGARHDAALRPEEREMRHLLRAPPIALRWLVRLARWLDAWGLFPAWMMRDDPLFASVFVANLGSLGIDRVFHHLYELGTVGLFCVVGEVKPAVVVGPTRQPEVTDTVRLGWTFDERIADAHYCVEGLRLVQEALENPSLMLSDAPGFSPSRAAEPLSAESWPRGVGGASGSSSRAASRASIGP